MTFIRLTQGRKIGKPNRYLGTLSITVCTTNREVGENDPKSKKQELDSETGKYSTNNP
jgi:hypothetical protein